MLRFPHWMACQWRVEMGFVREVGLSCVRPDNGWRAHVNSGECIQGSSSGVLRSVWKNIPFIYSQALLSCFSLDVSALFSIFSFNQFFSYGRFASFPFLNNCIEQAAVIYVNVTLQIVQMHWFWGDFIFSIAGLYKGCVKCCWFISMFDRNQAGLGENKSFSGVWMKSKYQQSRGTAGQSNATKPLLFYILSQTATFSERLLLEKITASGAVCSKPQKPTER